MLVYNAAPWCLKRTKIAYSTGCIFWRVFFHFLPLLPKTPAILESHRPQLSWSIPPILRFHSGTLLNPSWVRRSRGKRNNNYDPILSRRSRVSMAMAGRNLDFLSLSVGPLCPRSSCELHSCAELPTSQKCGRLKERLCPVLPPTSPASDGTAADVNTADKKAPKQWNGVAETIAPATLG